MTRRLWLSFLVCNLRRLALTRSPGHTPGRFPGGPGPLDSCACWPACAPGPEDGTLMAPSSDSNLSCFDRLLIQPSDHQLPLLRAWWISRFASCKLVHSEKKDEVIQLASKRCLPFTLLNVSVQQLGRWHRDHRGTPCCSLRPLQHAA